MGREDCDERPQREPSNADIARAIENLSVQVASLNNQIARFDRHLTGGEDPEAGLIIRIDRLEQARATREEENRITRNRTWAAIVVALGALLATAFTSVSRWVTVSPPSYQTKQP